MKVLNTEIEQEYTEITEFNTTKDTMVVTSISSGNTHIVTDTKSQPLTSISLHNDNLLADENGKRLF